MSPQKGLSLILVTTALLAAVAHLARRPQAPSVSAQIKTVNSSSASSNTSRLTTLAKIREPFPHISPTFDERLDSYLSAHPSASLVEVVSFANEALKEAGLGLPLRLAREAIDATVKSSGGASYFFGPALIDNCQRGYTVVPVSRMDRKSAALVAAFGTAIVPFTQSLEPATAIVFSREGVRIAEMPIPFNAQPTGLDVASGEILIPYSISARWESWWFDNRPASAPESNRPFLMTTFSRDRFYFSAIPKHYRREPWDKRDQFDNGVNKIILKSPFSGEKIEITNSCF